MHHGPAYRSGRDPDLDTYRARKRFGHHKGDAAAREKRPASLTSLIFMALLAVMMLVLVRNMSLAGMWTGVKTVAVATGCAVAHDLGRPGNGDKRMWADGAFRESGGCSEKGR